MSEIVIRDATTDDIPSILVMAGEFYKTTCYSTVAPMDEDTVVNLANILFDTGVFKVADLDGDLYGMIGLVVFPFGFNAKVLSAHEVVWYVSPDARKLGVAKKLMVEAERVCRSKGVVSIQMLCMANSPPQASKMYESLGYELSELNYTKVM